MVRLMKIVFHGQNACSFVPGFRELLDAPHEVVELPDALEASKHRAAYAAADVIIGVQLSVGLPVPPALKLYQLPGAGYDGIDLGLIPDGAMLCNCFGHEAAIAEYVMAALLARHVPLVDADRRLRQGDWTYRSGGATNHHTELGSQSIGLIGFGHIGKAIAARARAFGMEVIVANRSTPPASALYDRAYPLTEFGAFMGAADIIVNTLPFNDQTAGLVGEKELAAMRPQCVILNVGRGPVIDEKALYEALAENRIGGAIIDTWYVYPDAASPNSLPSSFPFHELTNVVMTPHMSGWTHGTVNRRRHTMADNINRLNAGKTLLNPIAQQ
ncbi:Glyoxylate/hydroxypyruvate reductase B (plasmid) [Hartmannibacter diazotrophicus]|uniref:Glyoxylate/hydroxypyruvate reductase B n=1 Tax=Hartmannibacter diazotrophicus TaxID=1482074 RepID=A0A2C9DE17_9HYPH|nr:2-hydroxyacid dehydrogenase [Hartmannibacter diazotrophicus]SON58503.1 Glyoxylate/hydroxypyruvate reductase B [Hartmannibacter diazotrophicus]